jgi:hypothetical protein
MARKRGGINPGGISITGAAAGVAGVTDHGELTGLTDDDHTQYLKETDLNAKGDLYVATADNTITRLPVGSNGQILTADSNEASGVRWAAASTSWITSDLTPVDRPTTNHFPTVFTLTADATSHTKGAYTELIASTSDDCTMLVVTVGTTNSTGVSTGVLVDIATGAAASESVIVANLNAGFLNNIASAANNAPTFYIPLAVASGTRISARCQAEVAGGDTVAITIGTYAGGNRTASAIDTIGAVTASSRGTDVAAGTNEAEGSWVEIEDSTANAYVGLLYAYGGAGDAGAQAGSFQLDVGTGAAAAESVIGPLTNIIGNISAAEAITYNQAVLPASASISAGTRIAARISADNTNAQSFDVILYGLRA